MTPTSARVDDLRSSAATTGIRDMLCPGAGGGEGYRRGMSLKCTACGTGAMTEGFLDDSGQSSRGYTRWISGPLTKGIFGGARHRGRDKERLVAYRCDRCNHVDMYVGGI